MVSLGGYELSFGTATRKSPLRPVNSDAALLAAPLFALADGSGEQGQVASHLAIEVLRDRQVGGSVSGLDTLIQEANTRIFNMTVEHADLLGMATTLTAALFSKNSISVAHVGDTRAYRASSGLLEQLTPDHRLVADLVAKGAITPEEALHDPRRSVITRTLGMSPRVAAFRTELDIQPGDLILLTCDGITDYLANEALLHLLRQDSAPDEVAHAIVDAAVERGSEDDVTAVVIELGSRRSPAGSHHTCSRLTGARPIHDEVRLGREIPECGSCGNRNART